MFGKDWIERIKLAADYLFRYIIRESGALLFGFFQLNDVQDTEDYTVSKVVKGDGTQLTVGYLDFLELEDTPTVYTGSASKSVLVKGDETGLEFGLPTGGVTSWVEISTSQSLLVNKGYIINDISQLVLTLPLTAIVGSLIRVVGKGAGGWKIAQNAGQTIHFGNKYTETGAGGYLESAHYGDCCSLLCVTANNSWKIIDFIGNININEP